MNITLFVQILQTLDQFLSKNLLKTVKLTNMKRGINSWTHLVTMLFCQFSKLNSLRDVCNGLKSASGNLNHLNVKQAASNSSLSYQNKHRDWELSKNYYFDLLGKLTGMADFRQTRFKIKSKILLLDSTTILSGKTPSQVADDLGIRAELINRWKREYEQYKTGSFSGKGNMNRDALQQEKVIQSMSRKGDCWDNAVAENFFKI